MRISRFSNRPFIDSPLRPVAVSPFRAIVFSPHHRFSVSPFRRFTPSPLRPVASQQRRGSVLVMVIAILVLMALIGTAYVSVARIDRQAAATGSANTQMNLLTSAVSQQVDSFILNGLFGTPTGATAPFYRPASDSAGNLLEIQTGYSQANYTSAYSTVVYHDYDSQFDDRDAWLASRVPEPVDVQSAINETYAADANAFQAISGTNPLVWPAITILQSGSLETSAWNVDAPYNVSSPATAQTVQVTELIGDATHGKQNYRFAPTSVQIGGQYYPAMTVYQIDSALTLTQKFNILAADADGDGVADSLYFKLGSQPDPGITYYAAVRIVDSNSAVNASTAWSLNNDFDGNPNPAANMGSKIVCPNSGFFTSNIGLEEMLRDYNNTATPAYSPQMDALNQYRFNDSSMTTAGLQPMTNSTAYAYSDPYNTGSPTTSWKPTAFNGNLQFLTYGDMLYMQLGRRLDNPGYNAMGGTVTTFRSLSWADQAALAERFCLAPTSPSSTVESLLSTSLESTQNYNYNPSTASYPANDVFTSNSSYTTPTTVSASAPAYWYNDNFNYDAEFTGAAWQTTNYFLPRRALIVARSPVSDNTPWDSSVTTGNGTAAKPQCRANLNTSQLGDLYNAFLCVMNRFDNTGTSSGGTIYGPFSEIPFSTGGGNLQGVAAGASTMANTEVQQLRARLATVNTITMRDHAFTAMPASGKASPMTMSKVTPAKKAYVYGVVEQPFITEVVIQTIGTGQSYMVIKLYNPYNTDIKLDGWVFAAYASGSMSSLYPIPTGTIAYSGKACYIIAGNSGNSGPQPTGGGTGNEPNTLVGVPSGANITTISAGASIPTAATDLVLLRPSTTSGSITINDPTSYVPVDQIDYSSLPAAQANYAILLEYVRPGTYWQFVYPGDATGGRLSLPANFSTAPASGTYGCWKVDVYGINSTGSQLNAAAPDPYVGGYNAAMPILSGISWTSDLPTLTYTFSIPLSMDTLASGPGPNYSTGAPYTFPFGAFARDGDAFQIPFIGAYVVVDATTATTVYVANSVTMDAACAEDQDHGDDAQELIGKFYPMGSPTVAAPTPTLDYAMPFATSSHRYYFARYLLDYVGATSTPNSDYLPNNDASIAQPVPNNANLHPSNGSETDYSSLANHDMVISPPNYNNEYDQPNDGLINVNTAPWRVLAMLPMVMDGSGNIDPIGNANLAKAIVAYRNRNGPFTSLFDLNAVVNYSGGSVDATHTFANGWDTLNIGGSTTDPDANQRDFTAIPAGASSGFPRWTVASADTLPLNVNQSDAKDALNMLTRISNLVTTRSDSFTVYIVVEGWKNANSTDPTKPPTRVSQIRQAYIVDRSHVNGINKTLNITPVPTN